MSPSSHPDIDALIAEVGALRSRLRLYGRMLAATCAACAGAAALFVTSPLQSQGTKLSLNEITIVDASGKPRGVWSGDTGLAIYDSAMALYNAKSERRMLFNVADDEPTIYFLDAAGKTRMYMDVNAAGAARFSISDKDVKQRIFMTVDNQKIPAIILNDEAGKRRYLINVEKDEPTQSYFDADGKFRIYTNGGSFPRTILYDNQAKQRAIIAVNTDGNPLLGMNDAAEKQRVLLNVDGAASLLLKDADGNAVEKMPR